MSGNLDTGYQILVSLRALNDPEEDSKYPHLQVKVLNALAECERLKDLQKEAMLTLQHAFIISKLHRINPVDSLIVMGALYMDQKKYTLAKSTLTDALNKILPEIAEFPSTDTYRTVAGLYLNISVCAENLGQHHLAIQNVNNGISVLSRSTLNKNDEQFKILSKAYQNLTIDKGSLSTQSNQTSRIIIKSNSKPSIKMKPKETKTKSAFDINKANRSIHEFKPHSFALSKSPYNQLLKNSEDPKLSQPTKKAFVLNKSHRKSKSISKPYNQEQNMPVSPGLVSADEISWREDQEVISIKSVTHKLTFKDELAREFEKLNEEMMKYKFDKVSEKQISKRKSIKELRIYSEEVGEDSIDVQTPNEQNDQSNEKEFSYRIGSNRKGDGGVTKIIKGKSQKDSKSHRSSKKERNSSRNRPEIPLLNTGSDQDRIKSESVDLMKNNCARLIQKNWRKFKQSDALKEKKLKDKISSAKWICNKFVNVPSEMHKSSLPCKLMFYKSKISLLIEIYMLSSKKNKKLVLEVKKNSQVIEKPELLKINKHGKPFVIAHGVSRGSKSPVLSESAKESRTVLNEEIDDNKNEENDSIVQKEDNIKNDDVKEKAPLDLNNPLINEMMNNIMKQMEEQKRSIQIELEKRDMEEREYRKKRDEEIEVYRKIVEELEKRKLKEVENVATPEKVENRPVEEGEKAANCNEGFEPSRIDGNQPDEKIVGNDNSGVGVKADENIERVIVVEPIEDDGELEFIESANLARDRILKQEDEKRKSQEATLRSKEFFPNPINQSKNIEENHQKDVKESEIVEDPFIAHPLTNNNEDQMEFDRELEIEKTKRAEESKGLDNRKVNMISEITIEPNQRDSNIINKLQYKSIQSIITYSDEGDDRNAKKLEVEAPELKDEKVEIKDLVEGIFGDEKKYQKKTKKATRAVKFADGLNGSQKEDSLNKENDSSDEASNDSDLEIGKTKKSKKKKNNPKAEKEEIKSKMVDIIYVVDKNTDKLISAVRFIRDFLRFRKYLLSKVEVLFYLKKIDSHKEKYFIVARCPNLSSIEIKCTCISNKQISPTSITVKGNNAKIYMENRTKLAQNLTIQNYKLCLGEKLEDSLALRLLENSVQIRENQSLNPYLDNRIDNNESQNLRKAITNKPSISLKTVNRSSISKSNRYSSKMETEGLKIEDIVNEINNNKIPSEEIRYIDRVLTTHQSINSFEYFCGGRCYLCEIKEAQNENGLLFLLEFYLKEKPQIKSSLDPSFSFVKGIILLRSRFEKAFLPNSTKRDIKRSLVNKIMRIVYFNEEKGHPDINLEKFADNNLMSHDHFDDPCLF